MRRFITGPVLVGAMLRPVAPAIASPVLLEDAREISVFAQASDPSGEGPPIGPVIISPSAPGAFFAEQRAVVANSPAFGASAISGGVQFSRFHAGPGVHFEADGAAEAQVDLLDPEATGQAESLVSVRLVFELSEDTPYTLAGELTMFAIGGVASEVRVTLRAGSGVSPWFERTAAGGFDSSGVLEEGTWVLELLADAHSAPLPDAFESSSAVASFRGVHFILTPAPGVVGMMGVAGTLACRRRRADTAVCSVTCASGSCTSRRA
ncbi:MAG: hypothetical protein ACIARR_11220 [Phycisphaerales bacterium JB059]